MCEAHPARRHQQEIIGVVHSLALVGLAVPAILFDGGADGLAAFRSLARVTPRLMAPGGIAIVEMGWDQRERVEKIFTTAGFAVLGAQRDLGGIDRALVVGR